MRAAFHRFWTQWQVWRYKSKRAAPRFIEAQAREVAHLADLAERAVLPEQNLSPLRLLREEMEALAVAAAQQEFAHLSLERRYTLSERLERTQQFLLTTMQEGSPPTQRIQ